MEVIQRKIEFKRSDIFTLYALGDIHLGVVHCDEHLFKKTIDEIKNNPKALWLGMGDYADCVTPSDFKRWDGAILADWMRGQEDNIGMAQLQKTNEYLTPIWDKCLGLIEGNHEASIKKFNHFDFMKNLLQLANEKHNVPYGGVSCFVHLMFSINKEKASNNRGVIIHARHGEGAARTSGARALAVLRLSQSMVNAHITLMGHLHGQESPDIPQRLLLQGGKIKAFETIATMTGSYLRAYMQGVPPTYLERWGTPPSVLGCPKIKIRPENSEIILEKVRHTYEI